MLSIGARPVSNEDPVPDKKTGELRKGYATTERARRRNNPEDLRRPPLSAIRMEYMSFDGTVTMFLRVVAPETSEMIDGL